MGALVTGFQTCALPILARVDDAHVHARRDRVVEEHRMHRPAHRLVAAKRKAQVRYAAGDMRMRAADADFLARLDEIDAVIIVLFDARRDGEDIGIRSEEHTSELQSLMRISYAVFCLRKNIRQTRIY